MKAHFELKNILQDINGEDYQSYKSIEGEFLFNDFILYVDHVQDSPSSPPSKIRVKISQELALFPKDTYSNRSREIALRDFITRRFYDSIQSSQTTAFISIDCPGQEILEKTTAFVDESFVELRFDINLPSLDDKVASNLLEEIFFIKLPEILNNSIIYKNLEKEALYQHIETSEDADFLRNELENLRLIAFVAEHSILPRNSSTSSLPMESNEAVPFESPNNLKMDVELPNKGQITGMGLPRGITLIVGEKDQGKSTLLKAIEMGIYNHIPGDGREFVVSNPNSVQIVAEEGRSIKNVDISSFISSHASGNDTHSYSTENASADISQAANVIEAVELGADVLLIDQDSSADNFLIPSPALSNSNDKLNEGFTTYVNQARNIFNGYMVSSILVIDSSENYFDIADFAIQMKDYKAYDIELEESQFTDQNRVTNSDIFFGNIPERIPIVESLDLEIQEREMKISPNENKCIQFGSTIVNLNYLDQLISISQIKAIFETITYAKKYMDGNKSLRQVTSLVMLDIGRSGLDALNPMLSGEYAEFRKIELAAVINRIQSLKVEQKS